MSSREKQIEALQNILIENGIFNNLICRQDYANPDALINDLCLETAQVIYNNNYRKMDEITLKLDLGDRSAEEIQQIAEAFNKANEEEIAKRVAKEIYGLTDFTPIPAKHGTQYHIGFENALSAIKLKLAEKYGVEVDV